MRGLILSLAALAAACATAPEPAPAPMARIAADVALTLPTPPGYPETATLLQTVRGQFGERRGVVEAVLSLSPERVEIVLTAAGGPRLATVTWDDAGVREDRLPLAGDAVPVENILADIFVSLWPVEAVEAALPDAAELIITDDGARSITRNGDVIVSIRSDAENPARTLVRNEAFGYDLTIVTQSLE